MKTLRKKKRTSHDDQLAQLQQEVKALRDQIRRSQRLATVGTMTAMVAHEFNNILTPIINYAQLAKVNPALSEKAIARAAEGGRRASIICNAILGITRDGPVQSEEVNLSELIQQTIAAMAREPQRDAIDLIVHAEQDLRVVTKRVELQHVLLNLLINARAAVLARPAPRRIEIAAACEDSDIVIRVSDNGVGIAPENLDKVFEPFFTTKTHTDEEDGGSGLGLAFCRQTVTTMDGTINVDSVEGQGATFTVTIPAVMPQLAADRS